MPTLNAADEDWNVLLSFLPRNWKQLAQVAGAMKGLRQDKSEENCLRVLLMHLGCGFSMRETVVRAQEANLADLSDVALLKRLRKSREWLHQLCCALFEERGLKPKGDTRQTLRLIDATEVKEPGQTGRGTTSPDKHTYGLLSEITVVVFTVYVAMIVEVARQRVKIRGKTLDA